MSTMVSLSHGVITGGEFIQINYHGQKAPIDKLTDAIAANAFHDSAARFDPPKCHPRTRVKILDEIMGRIVGQGENTAVKPFLWLNGAAGAGKSAIAQSTIERCMERGLRLASFFFSKTDPTRNRPEPLIATLAYQLYQAFPGTEVQTEIISAISKEPLIFTKQIQQQFTALVVQPLKTYLSRHNFPEPQTSFLIVIDGLDECIEPASSQKAILSDLAKSLHGSNPCIQIIVASRPEHDIKLSFSSEYLHDNHTFLSLDLNGPYEAQADIRLYLLDRFAQIKDEFNKRTKGTKLGQSWPVERVIRELAWKSSGQFIYAATIIRYVESTRHRPDHRLDMVLNLRQLRNGDHPFAKLDELYSMILQSSSDIEKVLEVLSLVFNLRGVSSELEVNEIEKLLGYEEGEVETLFCDLGALVQLSESPESTLKILHASLHDYLLDKARSKQFHIDQSGQYIGRHMTNALAYLASYASLGLAYDPLLAESYSRPASHAANFLFIFSFPLEEFLAPNFFSESYDTDYFVGFYPWEFICAFLHILRILARKDPTCSYIEDHQHRILDSLMIHTLQEYVDDEAMALILALFCHLGSHRFVPWCDMCLTFEVHGIVLPDLTFTRILFGHIVHIEDDLWLKALWSPGHSDLTETDSNFYDYMHGFLRRVSAPNPTVYAKAAKVCFDALPLLPVPSSSWKSNGVADDTEDDPCPHLLFDDENFRGPWMFRILWSDLSGQNAIEMVGYDDEQSDSDDEDDRLRQRESLGALYFTVLGYLIFFLPRCGRSDDLITACQKQQTSYIEQPNNPFPIRWRRLHVEINKYLASALPTSNV
ncbi:hypothetical protein D9613_011983 [Agrocybe pediades]|uniref:Nephrocystin 3-like N-terminal domain-containing protein n=1 Tax=Agrocybe pediades TaxID=84607 RepID=A0A8H4VJ30_9AGAR|nr:hypothetical protein D9613_011983 [Agrocybe pediades]